METDKKEHNRRGAWRKVIQEINNNPLCAILRFDVIKPHLGLMVSSLLNQLDAQKVIINIKLHINITCVAYSFTDIHPKMCLSIMIEIHFWF